MPVFPWPSGATSDTLPPAAVRASLGCGNPTALAQLEAGDVVRGPMPDDARRSMELWVGCAAGALDKQSIAAR